MSTSWASPEWSPAFITRNNLRPALLLASQSPRRKEILKFIGVPFRVVKPLGVRENPRKNESPRALVLRLALAKAKSVSCRFPGHRVLGADTVVASRGKIFGKPKDRREAAKMLMALQNRPHEVWTGVALVGPEGNRPKASAEKTTVYFKPLSLAQVASYLNSKEPYDKAGGYNIQGTARAWVEKWEGDYFNVVGLPVGLVLRLLNRLNPGEARGKGRGI